MSTSYRSIDGCGGYVVSLGDSGAEHGGITEHRELAHRVSDGLEVTLSWYPADDALVVRVCDQRDGTCFEIRPERHLALDVYHHPYAYLPVSDVVSEND